MGNHPNCDLTFIVAIVCEVLPVDLVAHISDIYTRCSWESPLKLSSESSQGLELGERRAREVASLIEIRILLTLEGVAGFMGEGTLLL